MTASCGPSSAATPASCAKGGTHDVEFTKKRVSDATLQAARKVLGGDRGIVDLVGTLGAYQLVAMMMVVDEFPLPQGVASELKK